MQQRDVTVTETQLLGQAWQINPQFKDYYPELFQKENNFQMQDFFLRKLKEYWAIAINEPYMVQNQIFEIVDLKPQKIRIMLPVQKIRLQNCKHDGCVHDLLQIIQCLEKQKQKEYTCKKCNNKINNKNQLKVYYYYQIIINQLNHFTGECFYAKGLVFLKQKKDALIMNKKYSSGELIVKLYNEEQEKAEDNCFFSILNRNHDFYKNKVTFEAVCLMKFTKLILPVRHKNCNHLEAYDLENVLAYFDQNSKQKSSGKEKILSCHVPQCQSEFNLENLDTLIKELCLDLQLIRAINLGYIFSTQFQIDWTTNKLLDTFMMNGEDEYVKILHENKNDFQKQQFEVLTQLANIYCKESKKEVIDLDLNFQYKTYSINLTDKIVFERTKQKFQLPIVYPARCYNCKTKDCLDARSYIYEFQEFKTLHDDSDLKFVCPICNTAFTNHILNSQIYIDLNLRQKMFDNPCWKSDRDRTIHIDGRLELLKFFKTRHKITEISRSASNKEGIIYSSILCLATKTKLVNPLTLIQCPFLNMISFDPFFRIFEKNNYQVAGLKLCQCSECINRPLTSIQKDIYFEELLDQHLINLTDTKVSYKWNKVLQKFEDRPKIEIIQDRPDVLDGFLDMTDDSEYQELFKSQNDFQLIRARQYNQAGGYIELSQTQMDFKGIELQKKKLEQVAQNSKYANFGFAIKSAGVDIKNKRINLTELQTQQQEFVQLSQQKLQQRQEQEQLRQQHEEQQQQQVLQQILQQEQMRQQQWEQQQQQQEEQQRQQAQGNRATIQMNSRIRTVNVTTLQDQNRTLNQPRITIIQRHSIE